MIAGEELRDWAQLALLALLTAKTAVQSWQKTEDTGIANARELTRLETKHDRELAEMKQDLVEARGETQALEAEVQKIQQVNFAKRLSESESRLENLRTELRRDYVLKDVCNERTAASSKEHGHDRP